MRWHFSLFSLAILAVVSAGCAGRASEKTDSVASIDAAFESGSISSRYDAAATSWADSVMSAMTLEQLAGQLVFPSVFSDDSNAALRQVVAYVADSHIGGVVLLKGTPDAARAISDTLTILSCAPPFVAIDAEWGLAMRLSDTPRYPRNGRISPSAEDSLLYEYGREVARECHEVGVNMVLGPVLDVLPEGKNSAGGTFIGSRSFGSNPRRVTRLGVAYARGLEDGGVVSVAKHFPGHGSADADSHRRLPVVAHAREQLDSCDLMPFEKYIAERLSAIMVGHLHVPALDEAPIPVSVSGKILRGMLREEMGFDGLIITDAMNMAGAGGKTGADAIMAGADIVLAPQDTHQEVQTLVKAVRAGVFPLSQLRDRVRRVLLFKHRFARPESLPSSPSLPDNSRSLQQSLR